MDNVPESLGQRYIGTAVQIIVIKICHRVRAIYIKNAWQAEWTRAYGIVVIATSPKVKPFVGGSVTQHIASKNNKLERTIIVVKTWLIIGSSRFGFDQVNMTRNPAYRALHHHYMCHGWQSIRLWARWKSGHRVASYSSWCWIGGPIF